MSAEKTGNALLVADDFGLAPQIDEAICRLADEGRLSATSVMTTHVSAAADGATVRHLGETLALGVHLNLTEGRPLGPVPSLAPSGSFSGLGRVLIHALPGRLSVSEIAGEFVRQIERFANVAGRLPDMVDGHQHVHALIGLRAATLQALDAFDWPAKPLVRIPADTPVAIFKRGVAVLKASQIALLTAGLRQPISERGFASNDGFGGVADLSRTDRVAEEFERFLPSADAPDSNARTLVMCHPAAGGGDAIAARRQAEYEALLAMGDLPQRIWHPKRNAQSGAVDWQAW